MPSGELSSEQRAIVRSIARQEGREAAARHVARLWGWGRRPDREHYRAVDAALRE
jgi:hypothetical protein